MSDVERAKELFYKTFNGVPGLRFTKREQFDELVDALVRAANDDSNPCPTCVRYNACPVRAGVPGWRCYTTHIPVK